MGNEKNFYEGGERQDEAPNLSYDAARLALSKDDFLQIDKNQSNGLSLLELIDSSKNGSYSGEKQFAIQELGDHLKRGDIPKIPLADIVTGDAEIPNWHDPKVARRELNNGDFQLIDANDDGKISAHEAVRAGNMSLMEQHAFKVLADSNYQEPMVPKLSKVEKPAQLLSAAIDKELDAVDKTLTSLVRNSAMAGTTTASLTPAASRAASLLKQGAVLAETAPILAGNASKSEIMISTANNYSRGFLTSVSAGGAISADQLIRKHMYGADAKSWETSSLTVPLAITLGSNFKQKALLTGLAIAGGHAADYSIPAPEWVPESLKHFTTYDAVAIGVAAAMPSKSRMAKAALVTTAWAGSNMAESYFSK